MSADTDRIQKKVILRAPLERVWNAITDAAQFGAWFGAAFDRPFTAGAPLRGTIAATKVDPEVAKAQAPYVGKPFDIVVDRIEPMRLFSFRWHPYAIDPAVDYTSEPTTLVTFELEGVAGGTQLTITESGFDAIPIERRAKAFEMNDGGWTAQAGLLQKYLAHAS